MGAGPVRWGGDAVRRTAAALETSRVRSAAGVGVRGQALAGQAARATSKVQFSFRPISNLVSR
jgi:hypothetical protein